MVVFSIATRVPAAGDPSALAWGLWMCGAWIVGHGGERDATLTLLGTC